MYYPVQSFLVVTILVSMGGLYIWVFVEEIDSTTDYTYLSYYFVDSAQTQ